MKQHMLLAFVMVGLALGAARAQPPAASLSPADKGTHLGVNVVPVPRLLYAHIKELPAGCGVVVTQVVPGSPAAAAGLQNDDILVQYDEHKIRDCEHLVQLIRNDKPEHKVKLVYLRSGAQVTAEATLTQGAVLQLVQPAGKAESTREEVPRAIGKQASPSSINVSATPLPGGNMRVNFDYYDESVGRTRNFECEGTAKEIDQKVADLPEQVRNMARFALDRIRQIDSRERAASQKARASKPGDNP
jgi:membrane-associated protease RseP (regulator of RpoE activity)